MPVSTACCQDAEYQMYKNNPGVETKQIEWQLPRAEFNLINFEEVYYVQQ